MADELFFRSCSPSDVWWDRKNDKPSSQLFTPTPKDEGKLSVASSQKTSAKDFYQEFTQKLKLNSRGIWAVADSEIQPVPNVKDENGDPVTVDCFEDEGPDKPTGHCLMDLSEYSKGRIKKIAKSLRNCAHDRGKLHP
ncbi:hypothetical protein INS43_03705 [Corynebacterium aurimucosum]|uniref:hypothetical protein n=1 Tax=Corynebacterium aurimucosum TaxID=169292 RepID=UPI00187AC79E|nr:hypothetical protein [Corynebacterium aurimucosum]MBE7340108.1 hypothetical protein [Corynebacterium aurimucosum]MBE7364290.1 hypothetical protein [Corynebacterium aurimucosum]